MERSGTCNQRTEEWEMIRGGWYCIRTPQICRNYQTDGLDARTIQTGVVTRGMSEYLDKVTPEAAL